MKKHYFLLVLIFFSICNLSAQNIKVSVYSEVSIFTLGPGDALFETFGHNAIRFKDPMYKLDVVFNYGTFDFRDPNFYTNFAQGRLNYWVGVSRYENFEYNYKSQQRWIKEQVLDLTIEERQQFFDYLRNNALPENRNYLYDPFYDNCSTKLRDITDIILKNEVQYSTDYTENQLSLRQAMNIELPWNTWGSFGINTALGSKLDKTMTPSEYMYLPDYLYLAFKDSKRLVNGELKPLVKKENHILNVEERGFNINWYNPMFVFTILFLLVFMITYRDLKRQSRSRILDFSVFFITGAVGFAILYLWFFTNHKTAPNNFNIFWAFAPNLFISFILLKKKLPNWIHIYIKILLVFIALIQFVWIFQVQEFTWAFIPLFGLLLIRYGFLSNLLTSKK